MQQQSAQSEAFRKWLELQSLQIIKDAAAKNDMTEKRIQDMANLVLELIQPGMDLETLFHNALKLNDEYPEFDKISIKLIKEYEEKYGKKAIDEVSTMVRQGQLDEAQNTVKKVLEFKIAD
jgi:hypothetical protein